jgi:hypothetical protein
MNRRTAPTRVAVKVESGKPGNGIFPEKFVKAGYQPAL